MEKNILIKMSLLAAFAININATVLYDRESAQKTKEVYMLSQLLSDSHSLDIKITGTTYGKKSFFSTFSSVDDKDWKGSIGLRVVVNHCATEERINGIKDKGYVFKSYIGDGYVAGAKESIKFLKENGAKYILFASKLTKQEDRKPKIIRGAKFEEIFMKGLEKPKTIMGGSPIYSIANNCTESSTSLKDWMWAAGQVASLALGVAGARSGNINTTSLAAHSSVAVNNTTNLTKTTDITTEEKTIASAVYVNFIGTKNQNYFEEHPSRMWKDSVEDSIYQYEGYLFPIEEVEEHLSKYMDVPYTTSIENK